MDAANSTERTAPEIDWSKPSTTVEAMAAVLGVSRSAAYEAVARGELPAIRVGARLVVPTSALRRLLELDESTAS